MFRLGYIFLLIALSLVVVAGCERELEATDVTVETTSPDGRWLARGYQSGTIRVWNTSTDQIVWTSTASERVHRGAITALSFSPDGEYLVSSGADDLVLVWNVSHVGTAGWDAWRLDLPAGTDDPRAAFVGARSIEVFTEGARMVYAIDVVQSSEGWVMRERRLY